MKGVYVGGNRIMDVTETKFLGVIIDYKLNWSPRITYISKKSLTVSVLFWKRGIFFTKRPYWHCIYICLSIFQLL